MTISELAASRGMSISALARVVGAADSSVHRIDRAGLPWASAQVAGRRPCSLTVESVAAALRMTPGQLLDAAPNLEAAYYDAVAAQLRALEAKRRAAVAAMDAGL